MQGTQSHWSDPARSAGPWSRCMSGPDRPADGEVPTLQDLIKYVQTRPCQHVEASLTSSSHHEIARRQTVGGRSNEPSDVTDKGRFPRWKNEPRRPFVRVSAAIYCERLPGAHLGGYIPESRASRPGSRSHVLMDDWSPVPEGYTEELP